MSDVLTQLDHLAVPPASGAIEGRGPWQLAWARLRRDRVALACAVAIVLITLVAIFAPVISILVGHGPETQYLDIGLTPEGLPRGPSAQFLFGTDDLGRDVLVPGAALVITTLSFNLLGDSVRDAFDPRGERLFRR